MDKIQYSPDGIATASESVIEAAGVSKTYVGGDGKPLHILHNVDLSVGRGQLVAVMGQSGSGKSTLLHLLGGLDRPTTGVVRIGGVALSDRSDAQIAAIRNRNIGFVFQFHHLLQEFSALENVILPMRIAGKRRDEAEKRARQLLERLGLGERLTHRPGELSGGEQQRAAVARALAVSPSVVLADEPSGNLDQENGEILHDLLAEVVRESGVSMVVVTHNSGLADRADLVYQLVKGNLQKP